MSRHKRTWAVVRNSATPESKSGVLERAYRDSNPSSPPSEQDLLPSKYNGCHALRETDDPEEIVINRHREIFYGFLFGLGAAFIDTLIDSQMEHKAFWDFPIGMALYRLVFVVFGCILGWLLWRKNQSERGFRALQEETQKLRQQIDGPTTVIHAQTQILLAKPGLGLPPEVESALRTIYEQSQKLQSINR